MNQRRLKPTLFLTKFLAACAAILAFAGLASAFVASAPAEPQHPAGAHHEEPAHHLHQGALHATLHEAHGGGIPSPIELMGVVASVLHHLEMTPDQHTALEALHQELAPVAQEARQSSLEAHRALHEAMQAEDLDEDVLRAAFAEDARHQEDLLVAVARTFKNLDQVLTPEQLQTLHAHLAAHFGHED
jgi:Spy/CpxP family protein refolding chaperone